MKCRPPDEERPIAALTVMFLDGLAGMQAAVGRNNDAWETWQEAQRHAADAGEAMQSIARRWRCMACVAPSAEEARRVSRLADWAEMTW